MGRPTGRRDDPPRRHLGVECHVEHAREVIRRRLRRSSRRPRKKAGQRDDEGAAHWRAEVLPRVVEAAEERKAHLVFLGESGFRMAPVVRRAYAPAGETPVVEAHHREGEVSAIGAVTVGPVREGADLDFRLLPDDANAHGEGAAALLARLRDRLGGPMAVPWGRSRIHGRSRVVKADRARRPGVVAEGFPGYAPDADPDEGAWGRAKCHRMANFAAGDADQLRVGLRGEPLALRGRPGLLASFIRHAGIPLRS